MSNFLQDVCPEPFEDCVILYALKVYKLVLFRQTNLSFEKLVPVISLQLANIELLELFRVVEYERALHSSEFYYDFDLDLIVCDSFK